MLLLSFTIVASCSSISSHHDINDLAVQAAFKVAQPALEKIFLAQAPLSPASSGVFPIVDRLPGGVFRAPTKNSLGYASTGHLVLLPGDYIVPVMTYCMNSHGSSPDAHPYTLSKLAGPMANVIREINLRALPEFSPNDVQILSWSIQNGLSYEDMTSKSREIIDRIIPDLTPELKKSFLKRFADEWDILSRKSRGFLPSFERASDEFIAQLGETGKAINEMRRFRQHLKEVGNDFTSLSQMIELPGRTEASNVEPKWSKISENVYARFLTQGHFQQIAEIQIRILSDNPMRSPSSVVPKSGVVVDLSSWVANPRSRAIQPLSLSALYGFSGVLVTPQIAANPVLMGVLLGAVIASVPIDWNAFDELNMLSNDLNNSKIKSLIDQGNKALHEARDKMEKPLRELGIIKPGEVPTPAKPSKPTRQYEKSGGVRDLQRDFDKIPGEVTSPEPDVDLKILPNGDRVVKRPEGDIENKRPTLEIQPAKTDNRVDSRRRIKVRYLKE